MNESMNPDQKRALLAELMLNKHRRLFPTLHKKTYLNYGAQGLLPQSALAALTLFFKVQLEEAPFSLDQILTVREEIAGLRLDFAEELGVAPENVALTENTSMGCCIALWGLDWRKGDHILLGSEEYPGVRAAVERLCAHFQLKVTHFDATGDDDRILDGLDGAILPDTRLVVVSHIIWSTGRIMPLADMVALCEDRSQGRIRILVDGAQSFGVLPLAGTARLADFYAFTGHKWLCGTEGVVGLYIHDSNLHHQALFQVWRALLLEHDRIGAPAGDARRFEIGSSSIALYAGTRAALKCHRSFAGVDARFDRIRQLSLRLFHELRRLSENRAFQVSGEKEPDAGLVFITPPKGKGLELVRHLEACGVLVRTIAGTEQVRISIHYLTNNADLDRLLQGMADFAN